MTIDQFHLNHLPEEHVRNVWQPATDDLHMNVLVLRAGEEIAPHSTWWSRACKALAQ